MGDAVDALDMNTAAPSSNLLLRQGKDDISNIKETQLIYFPLSLIFFCHVRSLIIVSMGYIHKCSAFENEILL